MRFADHAVVITGAGGGLGRAVALAFAAEGAALVLSDLADTVERVAEDVRRAGGSAVVQRGDVGRSADMRAVAERAAREFGGLHVLVTCAGLGTAGLLVEQEESVWERIVDVNLLGTYRAIRAVLPQMMAQKRGRIITIASILGRMGGYGFVSAYAASKHGVVGLTRALASELGAQGYPGITVNAVCPGYVRAGMGVAVQPTKAGPVSGEDLRALLQAPRAATAHDGGGGDRQRRVVPGPAGVLRDHRPGAERGRRLLHVMTERAGDR